MKFSDNELKVIRKALLCYMRDLSDDLKRAEQDEEWAAKWAIVIDMAAADLNIAKKLVDKI